ncbi:DUF4276 family protein [bacterium]|nr:DUF4276 family protein [bacterium]
MVEKKLFIEGDEQLRNAFGQLLEKKCKGKMPRIVMGDGITETINKFQADKSEKKFLLIDFIDYSKDKSLQEKLKTEKNIFFMAQKMETWFLSQPQILDKIFETGSYFENKLKNINWKNFSEPDKELENLLKNSPSKKNYSKTKTAPKLLIKLDIKKLAEFFSRTNSIEFSEICV